MHGSEPRRTHENKNHGNGRIFCAGPLFGQSNAINPTHSRQACTAYEKRIFKNLSQFHKNCNDGKFDMNGDLLADNLRVVDSNPTLLEGRARLCLPRQKVLKTPSRPAYHRPVAIVRVANRRHSLKSDFQTPDGVLPASKTSISCDTASALRSQRNPTQKLFSVRS